MSTITDDPMKLGAKSFPYKVQSGQVVQDLRVVSQDQYKFYLLPATTAFPCPVA
jgi:hypothetical protein